VATRSFFMLPLPPEALRCSEPLAPVWPGAFIGRYDPVDGFDAVVCLPRDLGAGGVEGIAVVFV